MNSYTEIPAGIVGTNFKPNPQTEYKIRGSYLREGMVVLPAGEIRNRRWLKITKLRTVPVPRTIQFIAVYADGTQESAIWTTDHYCWYVKRVKATPEGSFTEPRTTDPSTVNLIYADEITAGMYVQLERPRVRRHEPETEDEKYVRTNWCKVIHWVVHDDESQMVYFRGEYPDGRVFVHSCSRFQAWSAQE